MVGWFGKLIGLATRGGKWIALAAGVLAICIAWFWVIANYGFEGNGSGELLKIIKEAIG